jgi:hypothetical protein
MLDLTVKQVMERRAGQLITVYKGAPGFQGSCKQGRLWNRPFESNTELEEWRVTRQWGWVHGQI